MTTKRDELIAKINALRALSTSSNPNEAANAARIAEKLIQEHALSSADLDANGGENKQNESATDQGLICNEGEGWRADLAHNLADLHYCASISVWEPEGVRIYGREEDVANVRYLFAWLAPEIERLADEQMRSARWKKTYCAGAVAGIDRAMMRARREARRQATVAALVLTKDRLSRAIKSMEVDFPRTKARYTKTTRDAAFEDGERAGEQLAAGRGAANNVRRLRA